MKNKTPKRKTDIKKTSLNEKKSIHSESNKIKLLYVAQKGKSLIRLFALVPPIVYGFLNLKGIDFSAYMTDKVAEFLLYLAFFTYYISWVYGTIFDMRIHEQTLVSPEDYPGITLLDWIMSAPIIIIFILTIRFAHEDVYMSLFLFAFWGYNFISYYYLITFKIKPLFDQSKESYKANNDGWALLRLSIAEYYFFGQWIKKRAAIGLFFIVILLFISLNQGFIQELEKIIGFSSHEFIRCATFLAFVLVVEAWQWKEREKVGSSLQLTIDNIDKYEMTIKN